MATTPLEKTELRGRNGNKMADDAAIIEESGSLDSGRNKDSVVMARMGKKQQLNVANSPLTLHWRYQI